MRSKTGPLRLLSRWRGVSHLMRIYLVAAGCAALILPPLLGEFSYRPVQAFEAIVLLEICLYPTVRYFARRETGLPAIPIFCIAYAVQFAAPFFIQDPIIELSQGELKYLGDSDVTAALLMAIVGISAMQIGYYWFRQSQLRKAAPVAELHLNKSKAVL